MDGKLTIFLVVLCLGIAVALGPIIGSLFWGIKRLLGWQGATPEAVEDRHDLVSEQFNSSGSVGQPSVPEGQWFYVDRAGQVAPTTPSVIRAMLQQGSASSETLVWNETFGQSWKPIRDTEFKRGIVGGPPPLPPSIPHGKKRRRWIGPIVVGLILFWAVGGLGWLLEYGGLIDENMMNGHLPACDGNVTSSLIKQALENMPLSKIVHVSVIEISEQREVNFERGANSEKDVRHCAGTALMNSGKHAITYSLEWTAGKQNVYASVNLDD